MHLVGFSSRSCTRLSANVEHRPKQQTPTDENDAFPFPRLFYKSKHENDWKFSRGDSHKKPECFFTGFHP